jgi:hypothetical protein
MVQTTHLCASYRSCACTTAKSQYGHISFRREPNVDRLAPSETYSPASAAASVCLTSSSLAMGLRSISSSSAHLHP